ncbi:hypothetical protein RvY_08971 [Ramazzottius varieornatus]|uniref:Uncharacterized protein n=1 Tax=Ramazzottius varieornatus TaxID=947166 RepID=A0A1D1VFP4_RAMVA|nr:hypothetical protein RvY_08971 [Ramazzottius varieornatus]
MPQKLLTIEPSNQLYTSVKLLIQPIITRRMSPDNLSNVPHRYEISRISPSQQDINSCSRSHRYHETLFRWTTMSRPTGRAGRTDKGQNQACGLYKASSLQIQRKEREWI